MVSIVVVNFDRNRKTKGVRPKADRGGIIRPQSFAETRKEMFLIKETIKKETFLIKETVKEMLLVEKKDSLIKQNITCSS